MKKPTGIRQMKDARNGTLCERGVSLPKRPFTTTG